MRGLESIEVASVPEEHPLDLRELFLLLIDLNCGLIGVADPCHHIVADRVYDLGLILFNLSENLSGVRVPLNNSKITLGERDHVSKLGIVVDSMLVLFKERKSHVAIIICHLETLVKDTNITSI